MNYKTKTIHRIMCVVSVLSLCLVVPLTSGHGEESPKFPEKIIMVTGVYKDSQFLGRWLYLTYDEAFKRLGIELVYKTYPWKRCGLLADYGEVDGDLWRSPSYSEKHPNLVRVEEEGPFSYFCAWVTRSDIGELGGWSDLKGKGYKVDYVRGTKVSESQLPRVVEKDDLGPVNKEGNGFRKLLKGRTDVFIAIDVQVYDYLNSPEFKDSGIRMAGIMQAAPSHAYFHKKHTGLARHLSPVLRQMKKEGLLDQYKIIALNQ